MYGATTEKAQWLRFHTQTAGVSLTAQQPDNNIVRTAVEALAAVLGGTNSLHTNALDEVLALPSEKAAEIALRTQQVIMDETGVVNVADPLGGSWYVEALTDRIEAEAEAVFARIRAMGTDGSITSGLLRGIEDGWFMSEIAEAAFTYQTALEKGEKKVVGVNVPHLAPSRSRWRSSGSPTRSNTSRTVPWAPAGPAATTPPPGAAVDRMVQVARTEATCCPPCSTPPAPKPPSARSATPCAASGATTANHPASEAGSDRFLPAHRHDQDQQRPGRGRPADPAARRRSLSRRRPLSGALLHFCTGRKCNSAPLNECWEARAARGPPARPKPL